MATKRDIVSCDQWEMVALCIDRAYGIINCSFVYFRIKNDKIVPEISFVWL